MRYDDELATFVVVVIAHLSGLPATIILIRRRWVVEAIVAMFTLSVSFMYHACQALHGSFFLTELQWHRLDNIAALSVFGILFTYLADFQDPIVAEYVKFSTFILSMFAQEKSPWEEVYTIVPFVTWLTIPFINHIFFLRRLPRYDWKNFILGMGSLAVAVPFFIVGLDDENDPFRMYHGLWHVFAGAALAFLWCVVPNAARMVSPLDALKSL